MNPDRVDSVIHQLGHAYQNAGRLTDAYQCALRVLENPRPGHSRELHYRFASERDLQLGQLRLALERADLATREESSLEKWSKDHLALCEAAVGRYQAALRRLAGMQPDDYYDPRASEAQIRLWLGDFGRAAELGRQALAKRAAAGYGETDWTMVIAEAELHLGRASEAISALEDTLRKARSVAWTEEELYSLRCLAEAYRLRGDYAAARALLDDLDQIAARGPYRLIQADGANIRALLPDAPPAERRAHAKRAYRLAWCDGPPYTYHRGLTLAERTLRDLGAPLPRVDLTGT